ncbi:MAG: hypothetical protein ACYCWE_03390 [Eubacteriales bacterium]
MSKTNTLVSHPYLTNLYCSTPLSDAIFNEPVELFMQMRYEVPLSPFSFLGLYYSITVLKPDISRKES